MPQYTKEFSQFIAKMDFSCLNSTDIAAVCSCLKDFVAVTIAGSSGREAEIWEQYYSVMDNTLPSANILSARFQRAGVLEAAAVNAVSGHSLDLDDVHTKSITHLAAVTIPTALALGQKLNSSGAEIILAIVAGYEVGARIGEAINPSSYKHWHTTSVVGTFSSAAVAGKLLNLDEESFVNCMGSAGTQSAGVWAFLENGSMSKTLHVAHANLCGIQSAYLASLGFTGASTILEGERGIISAVAPEYNLDRLLAPSPMRWKVNENSIKLYPCCRHLHSAIDAALILHREEKNRIEKIVEITDYTYSTAIALTDNPRPANAYAAKFSLQYCIAAPLLYGKLNKESFSEEYLNNPTLQSLMKKITPLCDESIDAQYCETKDKWAHRIVIRFSDGNTSEQYVDYPSGDFHHALSDSQLNEKFVSLTEKMLSTDMISKLIANIDVLPEMNNVNDLFRF